nr:hypothetical protein [Tanacetum cinerariifolium]
VQDKESLENPFNEIADNESDLEPEATTNTELSGTEDIHPLAVQESPHDFDICQLIREECSVEVPEKQKQKMEDTMFDLLKFVIINKSNAENLLPIPCKCEVTLEDEIECNRLAKDVCSPVFTTFSNPLFMFNDDLDSSDNKSLLDEDVPVEEFKIYS